MAGSTPTVARAMRLRNFMVEMERLSMFECRGLLFKEVGEVRIFESFGMEGEE